MTFNTEGSNPMSTYTDGQQETYAHIVARMHPATFPPLPALPAGWTWRWTCTVCGRRSFASYATEAERDDWLAAHRRTCVCHLCENDGVIINPYYDGQFPAALAPRIPCPACQPATEPSCPACGDAGVIGDLLGGTVACSECRPRVIVGRR